MVMTVKRLLTIILLYTGVGAGCAVTHKIDRAASNALKPMTEWMKKRHEERLAAKRAEEESRKLTMTKRAKCHAMKQSVQLPHTDPDLAYLRLRRFFGYQTPEDIKKAQGAYAEWIFVSQYRHETLPGVRYAMHQDVVWRSSVYGPSNVWLNIDIEKAERGSVVRWEWCRGADGWEKLGNPVAVQRHLSSDILHVAAGKTK